MLKLSSQPPSQNHVLQLALLLSSSSESMNIPSAKEAKEGERLGLLWYYLYLWAHVSTLCGLQGIRKE